MPGVRNHVVLMSCGQVAVHEVATMGQYAVATALRRPQLNRNLDRRKTISGKEDGERINNDGGLDPRVLRERLRRKFFSENLLAEVGRRLLAKRNGAGKIGIGTDQHEAGVTAPREPEEAEVFPIDLGS